MNARRQTGFSLLEVMVAFVILAAALGLLLGMLSRGLHQVSQAGNQTEASLHAQSLLDELGTLQPLEPGVRDGEFEHGRYRWRLQVSQARDPAPPPPPADGQPPPAPVPGLAQPLLYRVALEVEWGSGRPAQQLRFATLRVRSPPEQDAGADSAVVGGAP